jgi:hypothetical protein
MDEKSATRTPAADVAGSTAPSAHGETYSPGDPRLLGIERGSIVVGHDGSAGADAALEVALGLADDLGVPIAVVRTWSIFDAPNPAGFTFGYASSFPELATAVRKALGEDTAAATARHPGLRPQLREVRELGSGTCPRRCCRVCPSVLGCS